MLVSIIVPVYNAEKYLCQCIDSLLDQIYKKIEIILIDDGSTDACPNICDNYAEKYAFIKVIHKKNGGLSSAWMCGIENMHEESGYVLFVDSDDWVAQGYIEHFVKAMDKYHPDIVIGNMVKFRDDKQKRMRQTMTGLFDKIKLENELYPFLLNNGRFHGRAITLSRCSKLYKKELIVSNIKYCNLKTSYSEDLNIVFPVILDAQSIYFLEEGQGVYYYRMNPLSMVHTYDSNMLYSIKYVYPSLKKICCEKNHMEMIKQVEADYLAVAVQYFKNELQNPSGLTETKRNIKEFIKDEELNRIIKEVDWRGYRKLNVIIIKAMKNYNWFYKNVITFILSVLKKSGIRKPS